PVRRCGVELGLVATGQTVVDLDQSRRRFLNIFARRCNGAGMQVRPEPLIPKSLQSTRRKRHANALRTLLMDFEGDSPYAIRRLLFSPDVSNEERRARNSDVV